MPLSTGFTTRGALKGEGHIHSDKWHRCIEHVKGKSGGVDPYAVCTHSIGYAGSVNPEHRTGGRHASANPKRFKTKEGQRSARARERAAKGSYAEVLKYNPHHAKDGKFSSGGSGGLATDPAHADLMALGKKYKANPTGENLIAFEVAMSATLDKVSPEQRSKLRKDLTLAAAYGG